MQLERTASGMATQRRDIPRVLLAGIRLFNGSVGLLAPWLIVRRFRDDPEENAVAAYALRMFGIRTILIAHDLLLPNEPARAHAVRVAPIIHASDTVAAVLAVRSGKLPRQTAGAIVAVSAINTLLALSMRRLR